MSSGRSERADSRDLTAQARIRDAAMDLFAEHGFHATTIRAVAERAKVSAPLVMHHFGTKDGLRRACDEHLLTWFRSEKGRVFAGGDLPTRAHFLHEHPELARLHGYLRRSILAGGRIADEIFDRFVVEAETYLDVGEKAGLVRPHPDPRARAAVSTAFGLGMLVVEAQVARHLGGDNLMDERVMDRYVAFATDFYTHGLLTRPITFAPQDGTDKEE